MTESVSNRMGNTAIYGHKVHNLCILRINEISSVFDYECSYATNVVRSTQEHSTAQEAQREKARLPLD